MFSYVIFVFWLEIIFDDVGNISSSVSVEDVRLSLLKLMYIWSSLPSKKYNDPLTVTIQV